MSMGSPILFEHDGLGREECPAFASEQKKPHLEVEQVQAGCDRLDVLKIAADRQSSATVSQNSRR
jgi:hypothetical protein